MNTNDGGRSRRVNALKQQQYNRKWRAKQAKIKLAVKELDRLADQLAKLPKCAACERDRLACRHLPAHRELLERTELARSELQQLEH